MREKPCCFVLRVCERCLSPPPQEYVAEKLCTTCAKTALQKSIHLSSRLSKNLQPCTFLSHVPHHLSLVARQVHERESQASHAHAHLSTRNASLTDLFQNLDHALESVSPHTAWHITERHADARLRSCYLIHTHVEILKGCKDSAHTTAIITKCCPTPCSRRQWCATL